MEAAGDLGSGGGIPALPLACHVAGTSWLLIEAAARRAAFLRRAVAQLGLEDRVTVREERAEITGRDPGLRGRLDLVLSRSFGPPPVVAECAAPLLRVGGRLVVSEPPEGRDERWPPEGVALVGLRPRARVMLPAGTFQVLEQGESCPDRFPRRVGVPGKRPLF